MNASGAVTRELLERRFLDAYRELKEFEKGVDIDVDIHYYQYDLLDDKVDEAWTVLENYNDHIQWISKDFLETGLL